MPTKEKRATCVRCGRKRLKSLLICYYWSNCKNENKVKWFKYPQRNSWICFEKCIEFKI